MPPPPTHKTNFCTYFYLLGAWPTPSRDSQPPSPPPKQHLLGPHPLCTDLASSARPTLYYSTASRRLQQFRVMARERADGDYDMAGDKGYFLLDVPDTPRGSDAHASPCGAYISTSRIGELCPKPDAGSEDDNDEASSDDETDDTDWSDSDEEVHQPQRPSEDIGPVQDSIWNARYPPPPPLLANQRSLGGWFRLHPPPADLRPTSASFQQLMGLADTENKYQQLAHLAHDFQHAAEVYGRIIISERFVPVDYKTIKPMDIGSPTFPLFFTCTLPQTRGEISHSMEAPGGIAGGEKFIVQSILFKYALDTEIVPGLWMYGGDFPDDASAMKAAGAHHLYAASRRLCVCMY